MSAKDAFCSIIVRNVVKSAFWERASLNSSIDTLLPTPADINICISDIFLNSSYLKSKAFCVCSLLNLLRAFYISCKSGLPSNPLLTVYLISTTSLLSAFLISTSATIFLACSTSPMRLLPYFCNSESIVFLMTPTYLSLSASSLSNYTANFCNLSLFALTSS